MRLSPKIIDEVITDDGIAIQVVQDDGVWAVLRDGESFALRRAYVDKPNKFLYPKTFFPLKGHAITLARRMNKAFNCDSYKVVKIK